MVNGQRPNRTYHYTIDIEGRLWIEGAELCDKQVLKFFMRQTEKLPDGKYRVLCMGETNLIEAEDVPYVVQGVDNKDDQVELIFPGGYREVLDPSTLYVGQENVLYCKIRQGKFIARFNRQPYMELTKSVERDAERNYFLTLGGKQYIIPGVEK